MNLLPPYRATNLLGFPVPRCIGNGWNESHGPLGQCGNRQAGVDPKVRRHHRPIADVHILVAEYTVTVIDYALRRRTGDDAPTQAVRRAGNIEQNLR